MVREKFIGSRPSIKNETTKRTNIEIGFFGSLCDAANELN